MAPTPDQADVSFGILGPLTVLRHDEPITVGGPKERLLLAYLLARANQVVTVDALIDALWADDPPATAERTLQAYVARLRRSLEPDRVSGTASTVLVRTGSGYQLRVASVQVDALRFEELARRGGQQLRDGDGAARLTLRDALSLWRGDAMGEFLDVEACESEGRRLDEMRLVAIEDRLDADLATGAASELVAELESLVAGHELRERFWTQLMLALYRSGRQSDALATYRRARAVLVEQMGIEPGHELRALEAAILDQDPALDLRPAGAPAFGLPPALEIVGPAFVGRDAELAWLRAAWLDAADGRGGFVSVLGPEGIGKTRLLAELAREVQRAGGLFLYGRCGDGGTGVRTVLGQALGSVGVSLEELDGAPLAELGEMVTQIIATASRGRTVLLAIDDVHRADADTIELLADLAAWSDAGSLLVVATFRADADAPDPVVPGQADVGSHLVLRGLDRDALQRVCEIYAVERWWTDDIDRLHELTGGIPLRVHELASEWARERAVRTVGAAADRSAAAQARLAGLRAEIAQSVESIQHVLEQRRANIAPRQAESRPGDDVSPPSRPYKGLAAFEPSDAADFFGRERLVAELVARLAGARLLVVVGPSGSGKSSLVRAGLLPALASGVLPVSGGWTSVIVTPTTPHGIRDVVADGTAWAKASAGRRLVFVDQFEELFMTGRDRREQVEFVGRVVAAAWQPERVVVIALRADHLDECASFPELAELMTGNDVLVGPMRDVELRRAIERPAHRAGGTFEPGLVDRVISDVAGRPGALPLLSTALAETWQRRLDGVLTLDGYLSAGGVNGALATMAEETYAVLEPGQQLAARRLLMRLCESDEIGMLDLRRRLPLAELESDDDARRALAALVERRLLVVDRDTVDVAHEALLREWPRLRAWMDEDVQGRRLHRRISEAAQVWASSGEDMSELYRGTRLDSALEWATIHATDVNPAERAFLDAGRREAARELEQARQRAADKARNNRRLRLALAGVASLLVIAMVAGLLFVRQRDRAEQTAREARARALASESIRAIDEDPELAILLGLEAVDTTRRAGDDPLPEAITALQQATQSSRLVLRREEASLFVDVSDDGSRIATDSILDKGTVLIWDAVSGELLRTLPRPDTDASAQDVLFSPDGRLLAVNYYYYDQDLEIPPVAIVWDSETGDEVARPANDHGASFVEAFSPDGQRMVTSSAGDEGVRITIWDVATASEVFSFEIDGPAGSARFMADGTSLLVLEPASQRVGIYSIADGSLLDEIPTPGFAPGWAALNEVTGLLALGSQDSRGVQIVDVATGTVVERVALADVGGLDWSANGELLSVGGGNASPIRILDVSGEDVLVLRGHSSGSWDVAFIGDERLASTGQTGELRVWDVTPDGPPALRALASTVGTPRNVWFSPDGSEIVMYTLDRTVARIAADTGVVLAERTGQLVHRLPFGAPVSPDWRYVASVDAVDGTGAVLDLRTLAPVSPLPPCTSPVAFSPDATRLVLDGYSLCDQGMGELETPAGADLRSRVVDIASGSELIDLRQHTIFSAEFNPEGRFPAGRYLVVNNDAVTADVYDVVERRLVVSIPVDDLLFKVAFDPTGRWLVVSTGGGRIWMFDLPALVAGTPADEAVVLDIDAHDGGVAAFAVSANGVLATSGTDGEIIRVWDLFTGDLLLELRKGPSVGGSVLRFSPNDDELLYSDGAALRRFPLDTDVLIAQARGILTRDLTGDECRQYLIADCP